MTTKILTYTGVMFDLAYPSPEDIRLVDIAHALARIPRFTGHGDSTFSVAQHSVMTYELARLGNRDRAAQAWALLHDAEEAYVGDVSSPLKEAMRRVNSPESDSIDRGPFDIITHRVRQAISVRFGVPIVGVGDDDHAAALLEVEINGPHSCAAHTWPEYRGPRPNLPPGVWRDELAEYMWLRRAAELGLR